MRRFTFVLVVLLLMLSPVLPWLSQARAQDIEEPVDFKVPVVDPDAVRAGAKQLYADNGRDWYVVTLQDGDVDPGAVADDLAKTNGLVISHVYRHAIRGFSAKISDEAMQELRRNKLVASIAPVEHGQFDSQTIPSDMYRIEVYPSSKNSQAGIAGNGGNINVDVAVVDSGIGPHSDLNISGGLNYVGTNCAGTGGSTGDVVAAPGHGTIVSGIIAAKDNNEGTVGVAPGAGLWSIRVNNGSNDFWTPDLICALDHIDENKDVYEVANLSLSTYPGTGNVDDGNCGIGGSSYYHQLHAAICRVVESELRPGPGGMVTVPGVTLVASAGNDCVNANRVAPAAFDEVITVSAMIDTDGIPSGYGGYFTVPGGCAANTPLYDDTFAAFSNYGADIDLAAPGGPITSTSIGTSDTTELQWGTSFAAPHVTGAAALYKAAHPSATPADVRTALIAEREQVALPGDPDGINEGVLNLNDSAPWADSTIPVVGVPTITESENDEHVDGTTVWYNNGNGHQGTFTVAVTASDPESGIDHVNFPSMFGDGGNDSNPPYQKNYSWTDAGSVSGQKVVTAYNGYGLYRWVPFTVTPDHADPTATITAPTASQTVSGTQTVSVTAADNAGGAGVREVKLRVCAASSACGGSQGTVIGTDASAPYDLSWDTTGWADGSYKLVARATDNVDNNADSAAVTVTVSNGSSLLAATGDAGPGTVGADTSAATGDVADATTGDPGRGQCGMAGKGGHAGKAGKHGKADRPGKGKDGHAGKGQRAGHGKAGTGKAACKGGRRS